MRLAAAARETRGAGDFPLQPRAGSHRPRDSAGVPPRFPGQGQTHLGARALRTEDTALRRAAPRAAYRPRCRDRSCRRLHAAGSRWACIPGITCAGRTASRGRASRGHGASSHSHSMSFSRSSDERRWCMAPRVGRSTLRAGPASRSWASATRPIRGGWVRSCRCPRTETPGASAADDAADSG